jgi:hypothetical protein
MQCGIDHSRYPIRETGYLPLLLAGGKDGMVVVQGYSEATVKRLKPGMEVQCKREPGNGQPVIVTPTTTQNDCPGIADRWTDPVLFDACLFRVWGDSELALFFGVRGVRNRPQYPRDSDVDLDASPAPSPLNRLPYDGHPLDMDSLVAGILAPGKNGHGKKG